MNHDTNQSGDGAADDFWGETPDWTDSTRRPRREGSSRGTDVTGAIKGLWSAAMSSGADGTREHRVVDASAPRPADDTPVIGPTMFDDLDTELPLSSSGRVDAVQPADVARTDSIHVTAEIPVVAVPAGPDDEFDDEKFAAMAPVALVERDDRRRGMVGGLDPLLVRIGAVAIATTLMVPLAIGWTSDDGDGDTISSAVDESFEATGDAASTSVDVPTTVVLDPADLPPAVPVQRSNETSGSSSTSEAPAAPPAPSSSTSSSTTAAADDTSASESDASASTGSTAAATQASPADDCALDYEVQFGDFWLRLADGAGVPLTELLDANNATADTPLFPDSTICLPAGSSTPPPPPAPTTAPATTAAPTTAAPTTAAPTTAAPTTAAPTTAASTTAAPTTAAPTTTEAPSTTANPSPPANSNASAEQVKQIIRNVWPDELEDRAIEIAFRESRFVPTAKNYCCYGIFQIYWSVHRSWLADIGITDDQQLFDPTNNARAAYTLYQRAGGWGPWSQTAY